MREPVLLGGDTPEMPEDADRDLRPQRMREMVGQREVFARLEIAVTEDVSRAVQLPALYPGVHE